MIKFLQKLVVLWEKSKFLRLMEMESAYLTKANSSILTRDINDLRTRLGELKLVKNPSNEAKVKIVDIEALINETVKYRQMIDSSRQKGEDLRRQIAFYRSGLWNS